MPLPPRSRRNRLETDMEYGKSSRDRRNKASRIAICSTTARIWTVCPLGWARTSRWFQIKEKKQQWVLLAATGCYQETGSIMAAHRGFFQPDKQQTLPRQDGKPHSSSETLPKKSTKVQTRLGRLLKFQQMGFDPGPSALRLAKCSDGHGSPSICFRYRGDTELATSS